MPFIVTIATWSLCISLVYCGKWSSKSLKAGGPPLTCTFISGCEHGGDSELPFVSTSFGIDARTVCPADLLAQVSRLSGGTTPPLPPPSPLSSFRQKKTGVQNGAAWKNVPVQRLRYLYRR